MNTILNPQRWNNLRVGLILSNDSLDWVSAIVTLDYSIGTILGEFQQRSNPCSFLSLPLELRRVIYRHLLIPSRIVTMRRDAYGIEPAILLSNKEIYEQASWVLCRDNDCVLLSINPPFKRFWRAGS